MPFFTGLEVLAALRQEGLHIPTLLLVEEGSEGLAGRTAQAGVAACLLKPLSSEEVVAAVERALADEAVAAPPETVDLFAERAHDLSLAELEALSRIVRTLTAQLDLERLLNAVVESAVALTEAEEGSLLLVDEETGELTMRAAKNFDQEMAQNFRIKVSDSLAGEVMRRRMPMTLSTASAHKIVTDYMVKDLIYVPLVMDGAAIGVLGVDNRVENRAFDRHHVRLLTALADYAVIAIRNARRYTQVQSERDTLNAILRKTEDVVIVADPDGRVLICNPPARRAFGIDGKDVTGKPLAEVIQHESVLDLFSREGRGSRALSGEIELESGQTLNAQVTLVEGVGRVAVMQDISHLKELDRVKSAFVANVSHDLRSPLTAILGYVELMERAGDLNETQRKFVDRIVFSVQSITALISDLLELGRIEAGFDADREPTPIQVVIRYAVESKRNELEAHQHELVVDVPDNLPEVLGNPIRLKQVIVHLLDNAIRYTPQGGRIGVHARAEDDLVIIQVSDSGIGIPAQEQHRVFEKFYRASNAAQQGTGTGLGLSMVKTLVEQHDGRVWVDSKEGEGSTFTIMLPSHAPTSLGQHRVSAARA